MGTTYNFNFFLCDFQMGAVWRDYHAFAETLRILHVQSNITQLAVIGLRGVLKFGLENILQSLQGLKIERVPKKSTDFEYTFWVSLRDYLCVMKWDASYNNKCDQPYTV